MKRNILLPAKALLLLVVGLIVPFITAKAQSDIDLEKYKPKPLITKYEIIGGLGYVSVLHDHTATYVGGGGSYILNSSESKYGFILGGGAVKEVSKHFRLESRFLFERKGFAERTDSINLLSDPASIVTLSRHNITNDYLTWSLIPQWIPDQKGHFNLGAGGYIGWLQRSVTENTIIYPVYSRNYNKINFENFDYGLLINAGYSLPIKDKNEITFQLMATWGLASVVNQQYLLSGHSLWYNNSYNVLVGFRILNST